LIQVTVHHHPNTNEEIVLSTKERWAGIVFFFASYPFLIFFASYRASTDLDSITGRHLTTKYHPTRQRKCQPWCEPRILIMSDLLGFFLKKKDHEEQAVRVPFSLSRELLWLLLFLRTWITCNLFNYYLITLYLFIYLSIYLFAKRN
jgi:hypothetical protein